MVVAATTNVISNRDLATPVLEMVNSKTTPDLRPLRIISSPRVVTKASPRTTKVATMNPPSTRIVPITSPRTSPASTMISLSHLATTSRLHPVRLKISRPPMLPSRTTIMVAQDPRPSTRSLLSSLTTRPHLSRRTTRPLLSRRTTRPLLSRQRLKTPRDLASI